MTQFYWEDFEPGSEVEVGTRKITRDEIVTFAKSYDPQPFHLDEELAKDTFLGRLCASGWQIVTIFSRIIYEGYENRTALVGATQIEECRWIKPVFPDDQLTVKRICLKAEKADEHGKCQFRWNVFDQHGTQKTQITGWSTIKRKPKKSPKI